MPIYKDTIILVKVDNYGQPLGVMIGVNKEAFERIFEGQTLENGLKHGYCKINKDTWDYVNLPNEGNLNG